MDEDEQGLELELEADALELEEGDEPEPEEKPLTPEQKKAIALEYLEQNPVPERRQAAPAPEDETLEDLLKRVIKEETAPNIAANAAMARTFITQQAASQFGLTQEEQEAGAEYFKWLRDEQVVQTAANPLAIKQYAIYAKGAAAMNAPSKPAPAASRGAGAIKWHPSVTEEDKREFMLHLPGGKITKEKYAELKKEGYIVG